MTLVGTDNPYLRVECYSNAPRDIPYALSIHDVPLCGTNRAASQEISTGGSPDKYLIEMSLCLIMSKTDLVSHWPILS
jgi:hypothetical protein